MKTTQLSVITLLILVFSGSLQAENSEGNADLILYNGKIITVDNQGNIFKALAAKGGKIIQLGDDAVIKQLAGPGCTFIDLKGKTATPGLIDSHYHMMYFGQQFAPGYVNIRHPDVRNKADLIRVLTDYVSKLKKDEWISGNQGFHIKPDETLDRTDIDKIAPDNPAYLRHGSGQYAVVNSRALEIAGITSKTQNPPSSFIQHDSMGEPTGILSHYPAENLVARYASGYGDLTDERKTENIERGQNLCLEAGYTSIQDVIVGNTNDIRLYQDFARNGKLKVRLYTLLYLNTEEQANQMAATFKPESTGLFTFGGWKLAMDGGPAPKTVLMYDKTLNMSQDSYPYFDQETLNRMVSTLHNTGLQVAVHVSGDKGIDMSLTAFEEAIRKNPRSDPRHRIEHGLWPTDSALKRMQNNKIILSAQPQWITWHGDSYAEVSDQKTMELILPFKTMLNMGIPVAFGCDVPASLYQDPKYAFSGSVFRRTQDGVILNPEEKLTIQEALKIHTMGSAYASFSETTTGSLEPGKFADITVWSHDLYTMPPAELINLKAEMTIVNGVVGFSTGTLVTAKKPDFNQGCRLQPNYPEPFSGLTTLHFEIPVPGSVDISVFNETGQKIITLAHCFYPAGIHSLEWNGSDSSGHQVAPGLYFCILTSGNAVLREKIIRQ